jgi:colicin import membrane protein
LKKKTFKPSEVINEAIRNVKDSVETSQEETLKKAMESIAREVESEDAASSNQRRYGTGYAGYGRAGADMLSIYKAEIFSIIQRNWSFSEHLAGNRTDIAVKLAIKIMPDGEIRDIWFDERSGNSYLDESAKKAVLKSNPLPPLPKGFNKPFLNQGLRFTPSGIK